MRSGLSERIGRLERHRTYLPVKPMSKADRDEFVRRFSTPADFAAALAGEIDPHRRAAIEAAMRADH